jgi:hypothetical protein
MNICIMWPPAALIVAALSGQAVKPLPTIEVTGKDVTVVQGVNDTLGTLSEKVTACVSAGRKAEECRCSFPQDLTRLRRSYDTMIQTHPDWKDQLLSYQYVNKEGRNISGTLVLQNLRRQLEALKCD